MCIRDSIITDGTVIITEFQKPELSPWHFNPVQASAHAFTQGSNVISMGGEKILPIRISGMPFNEVITITYKGTA